MHFRIARTGQSSAFRMARTWHGCTPRCQWCVWTWAHVLPLVRGGFGTVTVSAGGGLTGLTTGLALLFSAGVWCISIILLAPAPLRDGV